MVVAHRSRWRQHAGLLGPMTVGGALLLGASGLLAQSTTGTVTGQVTETGSGSPIAGASVRALALPARTAAGATSTNTDGRYRIGGLATGTYAITVTRIGYQLARVDTVRVRAGETQTANVVMGALASRLNELVTTATRGAEPEKILESPNAISVVSAERIAERPSATVVDHLKSTPGLSISSGGIAQANIVSRGFNNAFSTSMLMLQDYRFAGVPSLRVNVPFLFTGTNEDIDRIEVLQGPAAALYGPNSGNGVLHVITKSPFQSTGTTLSVDGGERSLGRAAIRHAGVLPGDKWGYKISGEYFTAKDFQYTDPNEPTRYSATDTRVPAERRGTLVQRDFDLQKMSGEARLDYRPSENTEFITTAGYTKLGSGMEITTTFGASQVKDWSYLNLQQRFRHKKFFAQAFMNQSNAGNDNAADAGGTYYLRTGIPVVDKSRSSSASCSRASTSGARASCSAESSSARARRPRARSTAATTRDDDINEYRRLHPDDHRADVEARPAARRARRRQLAHRGRAVLATRRARLQGVADAELPRDLQPRVQLAGLVQLLPGPVLGLTRPLPACRCRSSATRRSGAGSSRARARAAPAETCACAHRTSRASWCPRRRRPRIPGFAQSLQTIVTGLPASSFGAAGEAGRQQLLGLLASPVGAIVRGLRPTPAQVGTVLLDLNTRTPISTAPQDYAPLGANFSNTFEVGYKGLLGPKVRVATDLWFQRRPADPTTQILNPAVLFNPQQLGAFLGTGIATGLIQAGQSPAVAQATAAQAAGALTPLLAAIPVGATAFTNPLNDQPYLVFSYQNASGFVNVHGVDFATDLLLTPTWSLAGTYSWLSKNEFPDAPGASAANPLAANTPKHRATATVRYERVDRSFSGEVRGRYADAFNVNSGVFNSYGVGTRRPLRRGAGRRVPRRVALVQAPAHAVGAALALGHEPARQRARDVRRGGAARTPARLASAVRLLTLA